MGTNSNHINDRCAELLRWHQKHLGLYARIAAKHNVTPSYVSLIAKGFRRNQVIETALLRELERIRSEMP